MAVVNVVVKNKNFEEDIAAKYLEFTEDYVSECFMNNVPIYEWKGDKGLIREWNVNMVAGRWNLVVVADGPTVGRVCARPTGKHTLGIFRESKVREFAAMGIDEIFTRIYLRRVRFVRHSLAEKTVLWVWKHFLMPDQDLFIIEQSPNQQATARELGYQIDTSDERFSNLLRIIHILRRDDNGFAWALRNGPDMGIDHSRAIMISESPAKAAESLGYDTNNHPDWLIKKAATLWYYYAKANR